MATRVNIVLEAEVSSIALKKARGGSIPIPHSIWVILGDFESLDEDEDGFDFQPIQERDPETGAHRKNFKYPMGSLSYEEFQQVVSSHQSTRLIASCAEKEVWLHIVKTLKDIFETLGHEVLLLETCDF